MAADGRVNLLLVGSDSRSDAGIDESSMRTDSIILLSIEVSTGKAALFNFPRNLVNAPLTDVARPGAYDNDKFPEFLGYLWLTAAQNPDKFPGAEELSAEECAIRFDCARGWRALAGTIQQMAGLQLDGLVALNLNGFVDLIDNLPAGGVWLDVPEPVEDDAYFNSKRELMPLHIPAGCQFLDGEMTLAYARSRHQDSDYERTRRQQYVLEQIRRQIDPLALLPRIPALLDVARANLFMTVAESDLTPLAELAGRVDADHIYRYTFGPNFIERVGGMDGIPIKVRDIFSEPEPSPSSVPARCPAAD